MPSKSKNKRRHRPSKLCFSVRGREVQQHELGHGWDATGSGVPSQNSHAIHCTGFLRVALLGESDRPFIKLVIKSILMLFYIK